MNAHRQLARMFFSPFPDLLWQCPGEQDTLYLTFDDGPYPPLTGALIDWLNGEQVPAAFFLSGESIFRWRHQLGGISYEGHVVGSHGFFHLPHNLLSQTQLTRSIACCDTLIAQVCGAPPSLFRPPYGIFSRRLRKTLQRRNQRLVLWSLMAYDFRWEPQKVLAHLTAATRPGDIVVFHDSPQTEKKLLPILEEFVVFCRDRNWKFGALSDLIPLQTDHARRVD